MRNLDRQRRMSEAVKAQRRCMACHSQHDKYEMLRLVCDESGRVWPDVLQKAPGRGAYVCWDNTCLSRLRDRHLHAAWKDRDIMSGQTAKLPERSAVALSGLCRQYVQRQRHGLRIGRNAVMHRMWDRTPVLIVLAEDAGIALRRQLLEAGARRSEAGLATDFLAFGDSALLGELVEREKVSVLAVDDTPLNKKLRQYCMWYRQLKKTE